MGAKISLPSPSSSYFSCGTQITDLSGSNVTLYDGGINSYVIRSLEGCVNSNQKSQFEVVFDPVKPPDFSSDSVTGLIKFKLVNIDSMEDIMSAEIKFGFDYLGRFT